METRTTRNQTRHFWQKQYEKWQSSNMSKAAFCKQAALNVTSFYYWSKQFSKAQAKPDTQKRLPTFIPMTLTQESTAAFSIKLGDVTLSCDQPVSNHQLRQWLMAIRSTL